MNRSGSDVSISLSHQYKRILNVFRFRFSNGSIKLVSDNIKYGRNKTPEDLGIKVSQVRVTDSGTLPVLVPIPIHSRAGTAARDLFADWLELP